MVEGGGDSRVCEGKDSGVEMKVKRVDGGGRGVDGQDAK